MLTTYRAGAAFVPATADKPALSIGGAVHAGMNAYLPTATTEAALANFCQLGHEIYDPATQRWYSSAPSRSAGGSVLIPTGAL